MPPSLHPCAAVSGYPNLTANTETVRLCAQRWPSVARGERASEARACLSARPLHGPIGPRALGSKTTVAPRVKSRGEVILDSVRRPSSIVSHNQNSLQPRLSQPRDEPLQVGLVLVGHPLAPALQRSLRADPQGLRHFSPRFLLAAQLRVHDGKDPARRREVRIAAQRVLEGGDRLVVPP